MPDNARQRMERLIAQKRKHAAAGQSAQGTESRGADLVNAQRKRATLKPDEVAALVNTLRKRPA
jgi:hypothetical protein